MIWLEVDTFRYMKCVVLAALSMMVASEQVRRSCTHFNLTGDKNCVCSEIEEGQEIKCTDSNITFVTGYYEDAQIICKEALSSPLTPSTLRLGPLKSLKLKNCLPTEMSIKVITSHLGVDKLRRVSIVGKVDRLAKGQLANLTTNGVLLEGLGLTNIDQNIFVDQNSTESSIAELHLGRNNLSRLDETVFISLKKLNMLDMSLNQFTILPDNLFVNNKDLEFLILGYNRLQNISSELFRNQGKLKVLHLAHNQLKHLVGEWRGLGCLTRLDLSNNQLITMGDERGSVLRNVGHLGLMLALNNNNLTRVYPDWLVGVKAINLYKNNIQTFKVKNSVTGSLQMYLPGNNISEVYIDAPQHFNGSLEVHLSDNPLICDCHLHSLSKLSKEGKVSFVIMDSDSITCGGPPSLKGRLVKDLVLEELKCPEPN